MTKTNKTNSIQVFEMTGSDVVDFLKNQIVSEFSEHSNEPMYTVICNSKGRIIYSLFIISSSKSTFLAVDDSLSDNFLQYITMRKFRMDVNIQKSNYFLHINHRPDQQCTINHVELSTNSKEEQSDHRFWMFMFEFGLPWITKATTEQFIPQHVNLDTSNVIAFDKGCYPGQEIVARLHYLGSIKKRMKYFKTPNSTDDKALDEQNAAPLADSSKRCSPIITQNQFRHFQAIVKTEES